MYISIAPSLTSRSLLKYHLFREAFLTILYKVLPHHSLSLILVYIFIVFITIWHYMILSLAYLLTHCLSHYNVLSERAETLLCYSVVKVSHDWHSRHGSVVNKSD